MKKKLLSMMIAAILLLSTAGISYAAETDMPEQKTFGELLFDLGLVEGMDGGLQEDKELNRAQLVTLLIRLSERGNADGVKQAFTPPPVPTFSDVPTTHWAYAHVERAYQEGITTGIGGGKFGPSNKVTHQQAVTFLVRAAGQEIDYDNAVEEGLMNWGIALLADKEPSAVMLRADVFELMVSTLFLEYGDTTDMLLDLLPDITEAQKEQLFTDWFASYNPYAPTLLYYPSQDEYAGDDDYLAEASYRQYVAESWAAEATAPFIGRGKYITLGAFLNAIHADGALSFQYDWGFYMEWEEGPEGYWGTTTVTIDADGIVYGEVQMTEGEDYFEAEVLSVSKHDSVRVDDRMMDAYSIIAMIPTELADYSAPLSLYVLVDSEGVYSIAAIGSRGDGAAFRE